MKRTGIILSLALSLVLFFAAAACGPKEKAAKGPRAGERPWERP